jgi:hypothetical protein
VVQLSCYSCRWSWSTKRRSAGPREWLGKAGVLPWRVAPSMPIFSGKQQPTCSFMQVQQGWSLPCQGNNGCRALFLVLFFPGARDRVERADLVFILMWKASWGGVFVSSTLGCRSPREAPPHEGLLKWAESCFPLLTKEDGPLRWPLDRDTQNPIHRQNQKNLSYFEAFCFM